MQTSAAIDAAWQSAWRDFLANKIALAERRATPLVAQHLEQTLARAAVSDHEDAALDDQLVTLADLAHISGAARGDVAMLERAVAGYDAHLHRCPRNHDAMRMRAESLLRCHRMPSAFEAFEQLYRASLDPSSAEREGAEIAAFQLLHDAECVEDAVRLGADATALSMAVNWRELATQLAPIPRGESGDGPSATIRRHPVRSLSGAQRALLGTHGAPLPLPPIDAGALPPTTALRADIDWAWAAREYSSKRMVVVDDLLGPAALAMMQAYTRHGAHFRTLRAGYLGAFPADGTTHPLILRLAEELVHAAPSIFSSHALALWWIFKYDQTNPSGIGIHADPAAVNINLWLTDDAHCLDGGGLTIYAHVPELELPTQSVNREYESAAAEQTLRDELTGKGRVLTIPYRCNRAAIFISDQYHESLPFRFAPGYASRRANLTLLFGDRWSPLPPSSGALGATVTVIAPPAAGDGTPPNTGTVPDDDGWDVFS